MTPGRRQTEVAPPPPTLSFEQYCAENGVTPDTPGADVELALLMRQAYNEAVESGEILAPRPAAIPAPKASAQGFSTAWRRNTEGRALEVGMEVKLANGAKPLRVNRVGEFGAHLSDGHSISLHAEVLCRKPSAAPGITPPEPEVEEKATATLRTTSKVAAPVSTPTLPPASKPSEFKRGKKFLQPATREPRASTKRAKPQPIKTAQKLYPCLCGCGDETMGYFAKGHQARFKSWLKQIATGKAVPSDLLPKSLSRALGPWKETRKGMVPTNDYRKVRKF